MRPDDLPALAVTAQSNRRARIAPHHGTSWSSLSPQQGFTIGQGMQQHLNGFRPGDPTVAPVGAYRRTGAPSPPRLTSSSSERVRRAWFWPRNLLGSPISARWSSNAEMARCC